MMEKSGFSEEEIIDLRHATVHWLRHTGILMMSNDAPVSMSGMMLAIIAAVKQQIVILILIGEIDIEAQRKNLLLMNELKFCRQCLQNMAIN